MGVFEKRMIDAANEFEKSYNTASVSYNKDTKTVTVRLRTKMAGGFFLRRDLGTHYVDIPVNFSKIDGVTCGACMMYKVSYDGKDYNGKEVNPRTVFDPGVGASDVVKKIVEIGNFTARSLKYVDVRHVSY